MQISPSVAPSSLFREDIWASWGYTFDYAFTSPAYPVISVIIYCLIIAYFRPGNGNGKNAQKNTNNSTKTEQQKQIHKKNRKPMSFGLKTFVVLHNVLLFVFSLMTFLNVFPVVLHFITSNNEWGKFVCAFPEQSSNLKFWGYLFYLSKIWEFIDTFIILYKNKNPSTLQVYHHIGAVFACWLQVIVGGSTYWVFLVLNSFIHTIMYLYYAFSTIGYRFPFKFLITALQLLQFAVGQSLGFYQLYNFGPCYRNIDLYVWIFNSAYVWPLIALFFKFYCSTYHPEKKAKKQ